MNTDSTLTLFSWREAEMYKLYNIVKNDWHSTHRNMQKISNIKFKKSQIKVYL